ncbi:MAG: DEAD/DEAH box helicase [Myxococcota bacterium]|nr:DEAD/DEAH box helicase [Myxococcota bacterium]
MDELFAAVREECSPPEWSRGVELSRQDAVTLIRESDDEIELRVTLKGGMSSALVSLYPEDEDWSCDCAKQDEALSLVAAAVIALRKAKKEGKDLSARASDAGHVRYDLTRIDRGLKLDRVVVVGQSERRVGASLMLLAKQLDGQAHIVITPDDLELERMLAGRPFEATSRSLAARLFRALDACEHLQFAGKPVKLGQSRCGLDATLRDRGTDFELKLTQSDDIDEVIGGVALRAGNTLHALTEPPLSQSELGSMRRGLVISQRDVGKLVTDILPRLRRAMSVSIKTNRLPELKSSTARVVFDTDGDTESLTVLPTIVYGNPIQARVDGETITHIQGSVPIRDTKAESRLKRRLEEELGLSPGIRIRRHGVEAVELAEGMASFGAELRGDAQDSFYRAPELKADISMEAGSVFGITFKPRSPRKDGSHVTGSIGAQHVLDAYERGDGLVPLEGGGWAPLPTEWLREHSRLLTDLLAARDDQGKLARAALPDAARLFEALDEPRPPDFSALTPLLDTFAKIERSEAPADLRATLRDYQQAGVDWLTFMAHSNMGAMLADDMGLGKTLQALSVMRGRCLVVAPTSVMYNWKSEAGRFRPGLSVHLYHGTNRKLDPRANLTITSYAIVRLDIDVLESSEFDMIILDESQHIKNPESRVAQAAFRLNAPFRMTLSGTPVENRLSELWSQIHFLNPGLLGGRSHFRERYAKPIASGDMGAAAHLRERLRPFILRRKKEEVARELPARTDLVLHCELTGEERAAYDAIRAATQEEIVAKLESGASVMEALEALLRLRQAACHRALVPGQSADTSSKLQRLQETLGELIPAGHRSLVFSQWTSLLDHVERELEESGIAFCRLDGSTRDRASVVDTFQAPDGPPVMLLSLKAGGTGLNLTAADHVFMLDPWWNPAVEDQAADRAHRIGQEKPVFVHRLVARDTVEEKILELQERKRELAELAIGDATGATSLTRDDLVALLSD